MNRSLFEGGFGGGGGAPAIPAETLARLKEAAGPGGWIDDPALMGRYVTPFRDGEPGRTPLVLRPDSTERVAAILRICHETRTPVVPQGGNTGLTMAGLPHPEAREVVLSLERMNRIRAVDPLNDTMTVEAGVILAEIHRAAEAVDRYFPLWLGAHGSCRIGGNISTNAGGVHVLRYGNTRQLVLGLEVVTAEGEVWDGLRALRKDNAGYDLKQLFIGAEGTLGVITAAVLRLYPRPGEHQTAMAAVPDPAAAVALLAHLRGMLGEAIAAYELMHRNCFILAERGLGHPDPLASRPEWRVLFDLEGQGTPGSLRAPLEEALAAAMEKGLVTDAVIAASEAQRRALWQAREEMAEGLKIAGPILSHDVSVPVSRVPEFIERADRAVTAAAPGLFLCTFGHVGDGNIHYNPVAPADWPAERVKETTREVARLVHDIVMELGGSITAEHGVGRSRLAEVAHYKSPVELDLMRRLKRALDPHGILNPGKVVPME